MKLLFTSDIDCVDQSWDAIWDIVFDRLRPRTLRPTRLANKHTLSPSLPSSIRHFETFCRSMGSSKASQLFSSKSIPLEFNWRFGVYCLLDDDELNAWFGVPASSGWSDDPDVYLYYFPSIDEFHPPTPHNTGLSVSAFALCRLVLAHWSDKRTRLYRTDIPEDILERMKQDSLAWCPFGKGLWVFEFPQLTIFVFQDWHYADFRQALLAISWGSPKQSVLPAYLQDIG